jgi:outer membrane receptor protein involved in Fe transport
VYAESAVQWTPWLRTVAGLRADGYRFGTGERRATAGIVTPKLSVVAGPFFFHAGHGFHSNDARGVVAGVTPLVRTRGVEAGVRGEPMPGLVTSLVAWRLTSGAELVYAGDTGTTEPSRASRRHGIEWSSAYTAGPLRLDLDVALSRARFTQDAPEGNVVPGALERMISAGASYAPGEGWSLGMHLRHLGPRALTEDGAVRSRGSTLADARIGYRFGPRTQLVLDVFNLFDRQAREVEYYYASRLPGENTARQDIHFHPAVPRTFRLTLTQAF